MTDVGTTPRGPMSPTRRLRIWEKHGGVCVTCKLKIHAQRGEKWIVEHVVPLALGGADEDSNCGPAHARCGTTKTKADNKRWTKAKAQKAADLGIKRRTSFRKPPEGSYWDWRLGRRVMEKETT